MRIHLFISAGLLLAVLPAPAQAQSDRLVCNPPLGQAFPLELQSGAVRLTAPVLLNTRTVLGTDVALRFIYMDPNAGARPGGGGNEAGPGGDDEGGGRHSGGSLVARDDSADDAVPDGHAGGKDIDPFSKEKPLIKELNKEVWHQIDLFQQALNDADSIGTTIVYSKPGQTKPLVARLDLPDGMLLAQVGDHIEVLALTEDSQAGEGGLLPGDQIRSVGGNPVPELTHFIATYFAVKQQARKNNQPYSFQVWRPSESREVTIQVGAPPSIPRMF
jgi:hypothetical protein